MDADTLLLPRLQLTWEKLDERDIEKLNDARAEQFAEILRLAREMCARIDPPPEEVLYIWRVRYELFMPVADWDIRNEEHRRGYITIDFGGTLAGPKSSPIKPDGTIAMPFRDGAHIKQDASVLNLPAYVVYGEKAQQIEVKGTP
jgi:hypothetical protein